MSLRFVDSIYYYITDDYLTDCRKSLFDMLRRLWLARFITVMKGMLSAFVSLGASYKDD